LLLIQAWQNSITRLPGARRFLKGGIPRSSPAWDFFLSPEVILNPWGAGARCGPPSRFLREWVYDADPVNRSLLLQVFREKHATARLFGRSQDQGIPKGKAMQPVEINEPVVEVGPGHLS
jgi:hypothetical protein